MFKWLIIAIVVYYLLSKIVFPIFRITTITKQSLKQMQDKLNNIENNMNKAPQNKRSNKGDYIDYEEVK